MNMSAVNGIMNVCLVLGILLALSDAGEVNVGAGVRSTGSIQVSPRLLCHSSTKAHD